MIDRDRLHLFRILDCIEWTYAVTAEGKVVFLAQRLVQDAAIRNIEVIGAAAALLPEAVTAPQAALWARVGALGRQLAGQIFDVDLDALWALIAVDLAPLEAEVRRLMADR